MDGLCEQERMIWIRMSSIRIFAARTLSSLETSEEVEGDEEALDLEDVLGVGMSDSTNPIRKTWLAILDSGYLLGRKGHSIN